jgi:hypothetical protein
MQRRHLPGLAILLLAACSEITHAGERRPGVIESRYLTVPALVAPDSVTAGAPFDITVTTLGSSGCWQPDASEVVATGNELRVTPFDRVLHVYCTQALVAVPRTVQVRLDHPGTAWVRLQGVHDDGEGARRVVISHAVVVR